MSGKLTNCIKKYPLTSVLILVIWYLSLFTPPKMPLDGISFIDKWTHLVMYGTLVGTLWFEYVKQQRKQPDGTTALYLYLCPVLMSGIIELVQEYCTVSRSGDWYDFAANATGGVLGIVLGKLAVKLLGKP